MAAKKPVVAVDIDNVLAKHAEALVRFHNELTGQQRTMADYSENWRFIGETEEEVRAFGAAFRTSGVHRHMEVVEGAREALTELHKSYTLVVVTARYPAVMDMTEKWLDRHFTGLFSGIHVVNIWDKQQPQTTKAQMGATLGASYLIDDSPSHCVGVAEAGQQALLFGDYSWNQSEQLPKGVTRCKDWAAVQEYFDAV